MISKAFPLLSLPSISTEKLFRKPVAVKRDHVFVGISQSSINTLSLQHPQALDAFSVSPGTIITAVSPGPQDSLCYTTNERGKHYIKLVSGAQYEVGAEAFALYYTDELFVVFTRNQRVQAFDSSSLKPVWDCDLHAKSTISLSNSDNTLLYTAHIDSRTCLIITGASNGFTVHTVGLDKSGMQVFQSRSVDIDHGGEIGIFSYRDSVLYRCDPKSRGIYLYDIPDAELGTKFVLGGEEPTQMVALSDKNIVVLQGSILSLIDCTHRAKTAEQEVPGIDAILAYVEAASTVVAVAAAHVVGLNVTSTRGTLLESIGRGVSPTSALDQFNYGYADIFNDFHGSVKDYKSTAVGQIKAAQECNEAIIADLKKCAENSDSEGFSRIVSYLKSHDSWADCGPISNNDTPVYDESDRPVDKDLIKSIVWTVFNITGEGVGEYNTVVSYSVSLYLLTHPLFPAGEPQLSNLFPALSATPPLYRQAIISLCGAQATQIVPALLTKDEDIFSDAVTRLSEEFSTEQLFSAIKEIFAETAQEDHVFKLISRLSHHPDGWVLVPAFVDAVGLLSWDPRLVSKLQKRLTRHITETEALCDVSVLSGELLRSAGIDLDTLKGGKISQGELERKTKMNKVNFNARDDKKQVPRYSVESLSFVN